ncbi:MAG: hypothetical protein ABF289_08985 [Clostridiales bacterium]
MSRLSSFLTEEQKRKYMIKYEACKTDADCAVEKYFPYTANSTKSKLTLFYNKGMEKGEDIFRKAVKGEFDCKTVVKMANDVIELDVHQYLKELPVVYSRERKKKTFLNFYRNSISNGSKQSYERFKLLESFEKHNTKLRNEMCL